jgi:hypothetical protein
MLKEYSKPTSTDIAVCMCYFSSVGYTRPRENFLEVKSMLDAAEIPLFTAECIIGDTPQLIPDPTLLTRSKSSLFYKEQLFNMLEKKIPANYTKLIFLDSDIIFSVPNWVDMISKKLNTCSALQPFSKAVYLDASRNAFRKIISWAKYSNIKYMRLLGHQINTHPGFCWAFNRNFLKDIGGFFDKAIIGSGDAAVSTIFASYGYNFKSSFIQNDYIKWLGNAHLKPRTSSYLDIDIYHLYHGSIDNRQYAHRHTFPELLKIKKWDDAVYVNDYGMYEIKNPEINEVLKNYFLSRKEDD